MKTYANIVLVLGLSKAYESRSPKSETLMTKSSISSELVRDTKAAKKKVRHSLENELEPRENSMTYLIFPSSKSAKAKSAKVKSGQNDRSPCVDETISEFTIDDNRGIGDTLSRPGPAFAMKCGPDCYTVKDNGDDPPYDPELGDTLRFAYKQITSASFSIQSRVCGVKCDGEEDAGTQLYFGRAGLMIRDSLDLFARNVFVSHSPYGQADWSYRTVSSGESIFGFDGSPDVGCLWITLARDGNAFAASYAYEGNSMCGVSEIELDLKLNFSIEMPETVYVGLAVSTAVSPPYCTHTEADFNDIKCQGC